MPEFNHFDLINITIISISILFGMYKGLIKSIVSLLSFLFLIILTYLLFFLITPYVTFTTKPVIQDLSSAVLSFLGSLMITSIIFNKFMDFIKEIRGGSLDRLLGLIFGFFRGVATCVILLGVLVFFVAHDFTEYKNFKEFADEVDPDHFPTWITEGITYKFLLHSSQASIKLIPQNYMDQIFAIEFIKIDSTKNVSDTLKQKPKPKVVTEDENEYFLDS